MASDYPKHIKAGNHSGKGKDNLELFLNDVFEKECACKAAKEEVDFIQTGIETIVQEIVNISLGTISMYYEARVLEENPNKQVAESKCKKEKDVNNAKSRIIKAGSFYEGTKNGFPDEFDIIFCLPEKEIADILSVKYACYLVKEVTDTYRNILKYTSGNQGRYIRFDLYTRKHGPAAMLQFIYNDGLGNERYIHVDLVPALISTEGDLSWYFKYVNENVNPKSFRELVLSSGNYLNVNRRISFTESEVRFMRTVLSIKHVKMYRVLKFLINGHGDVDMLELFFARLGNIDARGYSSYQMKTMVIFHHDECKNPETDDIGPCVLQVLDEMCKHGNAKKSLTFLGLDEKESCLLPYLESVKNSFKLMHDVENNYDYETVKVKSLPRQYLDGLDRGDTKIAEWFRYLDSLHGDDPTNDTWCAYKETPR